MRNLSPVLLAVAIGCLAGNLQAKQLYVDATNGSDAVSYADNSASRPWRSLGRAVWGSTSLASPNSGQAARAGDEVIVAAGTYSTNQATNLRYVPIYNPVNSGSAGSPIVFRANGTVNLTATAGTQPIIGTLEKSYIVWDGFTINEATVPTRADTGPMVVWRSDNITVQNMRIIGVDRNWGDNHVGLRLEYSHDLTIRNNRISGFNDEGENSACVQTYDSYRLVLEHNECFDSHAGFFIKGVHGTTPQHDVVMRYNYMHDVGEAFIFGGIGATSTGNTSGAMSYVYQNLVVDATTAAVSFIGYDGYTPSKVTVVNNTFHRSGTTGAFARESGGILLRRGYNGYNQIYFRNNLITDSTCAVASPGGFPAPSATTFSHNIYYANDTVAAVQYNSYSLAGWQSNYSKDTVGTTQLDPQYMGATNFKLAAGSPARTRGLDVMDLNNNGSSTDNIAVGAYITGNEVMGPTTVAVTAPPMPPTDVQAVPQ